MENKRGIWPKAWKVLIARLTESCLASSLI